MRTSLRASIAALASIAVLAISAVASGDPASPGGPPGMEDTGGGSAVAGMCAPGYPDCVDTVVNPGGGVVDPDVGQSEPGYAGGGVPGSTGSAGGPVEVPPGTVDDDIPCGVTVEGPDGTVSYRMCPDDPGLEPEPVPVPNVVEPTPGMVGLHPVSFAGGSAYVSPDDPTVVIVDYWSGIEPCYVLDHVEVVETEDSVTITLFEGSDPAADAVACIEIGVFKRVYVTLDSPLGDRQIVDGAAV